MWAIMKAYKFSSLEVLGMELTPPLTGPQRFIPVFETRDQAVKFQNGDESDIYEMRTTDIIPPKPARKARKTDSG